jgi:hypothetical protein
MFQAKEPSGKVKDTFDLMGKSLLHLAVEYGAHKIV